MLDAGFPAGTLNYWKSAFLRELTDEAIGVLVDAFARCPSPMTSIVIAHYHGATSRVDPTATAFPHRGPGYSPVILAQWTDPADTNANIAWTQETFEALRPHTADRVYVNNLSADDAGSVRQRLRRQLGPAGRTQAPLRPRQRLPPQPQHRPVG